MCSPTLQQFTTDCGLKLNIPHMSGKTPFPPLQASVFSPGMATSTALLDQISSLFVSPYGPVSHPFYVAVLHCQPQAPNPQFAIWLIENDWLIECRAIYSQNHHGPNPLSWHFWVEVYQPSYLLCFLEERQLSLYNSYLPFL